MIGMVYIFEKKKENKEMKIYNVHRCKNGVQMGIQLRL